MHANNGDMSFYVKKNTKNFGESEFLRNFALAHN